MATPSRASRAGSAETVLSSPDPLNNSHENSYYPSSRRVTRSVTRSQRSSSFISLGGGNHSPRKQTIALEYGNSKTPSRLFVTLETAEEHEEATMNGGGNGEAVDEFKGVRRNLFQGTPTPKRNSSSADASLAPSTTTISVPLRDGDASGAITPKRRGRPKRSATPMKQTPGRAKRAKASNEHPVDIAASEGTAEPTPKSTTRKNNVGVTPKRKAKAAPTPKSKAATPGRRGRPRKDAQILTNPVTEETVAEEPASEITMPEVPMTRESSASSAESRKRKAEPEPGDEEEGFLFRQSPKRFRTSLRTDADEVFEAHSGSPAATSDVGFPAAERLSVADEDENGGNDGGFLNSNYGQNDEVAFNDEDPGPAPTEDTIAQEDFSMIFADSIASLRNSIQTSAHQEDMGEETSFIVNRTLEELRRSRGEGPPEESVVADVPDVDVEIEAEPEAQVEQVEEPSFTYRAEEQYHTAYPEIQIDEGSVQSKSGKQDQASHLDADIDEGSIAPNSEKQDEAPHFEAEINEESFATGSEEEEDFQQPHESAALSPEEEGEEEEEGGQQAQQSAEGAIVGGLQGPGIEVEEASTAPSPKVHHKASYVSSDEDIANAIQEEREQEEPEAPAQVAEDAQEPGRVFELNYDDFSASASKGTRVEDEEIDREQSQGEPGRTFELNYEHFSSSVYSKGKRSREEVGVREDQSEEPNINIAVASSVAAETPRPVVSYGESADARLLAPRSASTEPGSRPSLSPIVRAGRALQNVTSDTPSPRSRQSSLGSPFRPTADATPTPKAKVPSGQTTHRSDAQVALARPESTPAPRVSSNSNQSAPQLGNESATSKGSWVRTVSGLFGAGYNWLSPKTVATSRDRSSAEVSTQSPVEASRPEATNDDPNESLPEKQQQQQQQAPVAEVVSQQEEASDLEKGAGHESQNDGDAANEQTVEDDDFDLWAVEAQRSSMRSPQRGPFGKKPSFSGRGTLRRTGLSRSIEEPRQPEVSKPLASIVHAEVPASQNNTGVNDRLAKIMAKSARKNHHPISDDELAEYSLLSDNLESGDDQATKESQSAGENDTHKSAQRDAEVAGRGGLSAFFSSPNILPGAENAAEVLKRRQANLAQQQELPPSSSPARPYVLPTSGMFSSLKKRARMAAPSSARNVNPPGVARAPSLPAQPQLQPRAPLSESTASTQNRGGSPLKNSFKPAASGLRESSFPPAAAPCQDSAPSAPIQRHMSHEDIERWQEDSATIQSSSPPNNQLRFLRQLPGKTASPIKSCLRSPLKPRTPGPVVQFDSDALSPTTQAQKRFEMRLQEADQVEFARSYFETRDTQNDRGQPDEDEIVAEPEDVEMADASFSKDEEDVSLPRQDRPSIQRNVSQPSERSEQEAAPQEQLHAPIKPLSKTTWTDDHWVLLDNLIKLRRKGPFPFDLPADFQSRSMWLVGQTMTSHEEKMRLTPWHISVIDAFMARTGGTWSEVHVGRRLFSLLMVEQLRKENRGPKQPFQRFAKKQQKRRVRAI